MKIDVEYDHHPAFAPFIKRRDASADGAFSHLFSETDAALEAQVKSRDQQGRRLTAAKESFRRAIECDAYIEPGLKTFALEAHQRAVDRSLDEQRRRADWGRNFGDCTAQARRKAEQILVQGYDVFRMPRDTIGRLNKALQLDIDQLRRTAAQAPDDIITTRPTNDEAVDIVREFCDHSGAYDALSAYYGEPFGSAGFVIHLSHPKDTWFRIFDDIELQMPATTQMHYDLDFDPPKAMLYLNDVGEQQGPFSIVRRTAPWESFGFELALKKEMLYSVSAYTTKTTGKSTRGNTSIFRFVEARRAFASLPRQLRGTSHPGDHILDGTELSTRLLDAEIKLTGEAGTMPVFTGSHVLHRGGLVKNGERIALQIVFYKVSRNPAVAETPRSIWRKAIDRLHGIKARVA